MRKIAFLALCTLPIFAGFFPQTVSTSIADINHKSIKLSQAFPVLGMSGIIIHNYGGDAEAITSRLVQSKIGEATIYSGNSIHHDKLPTIKTTPAKGDKVIGGYLYNNVLLLAPDAKTYAQITAADKKNWIHPDLFAVYLSRVGNTIPTKENLKTFAKNYQVGLVYIVANGTAKLLDPISGKIVGKKPLSNLPAKGKAPFFMRLGEIESGFFSSDNTQSYYKIMGQF